MLIAVADALHQSIVLVYQLAGLADVASEFIFVSPWNRLRNGQMPIRM